MILHANRWRVAVFSIVLSFIVLIGYGWLMGYMADAELLLTVVFVRAFAGYGIGAIIGGAVFGVLLLQRKPDSLARACVMALTVGSAVVIGLATYSLLMH